MYVTYFILFIALQHNTKIIAVSVCKIPGCVFTAVPESYYIDKDEILQRYTFEDWKSKLLKSDKGMPGPLIGFREKTPAKQSIIYYTTPLMTNAQSLYLELAQNLLFIYLTKKV